MNKKLITISGIIIALLCILTIIFMFNSFQKKNGVNMKNDITIQLINPLDNRILTKQGERVLIDLVRNKDYSYEVVNTDSYSEWQPIIEKSVRLTLLDSNTGSSFIIPSNVAHWEEGRAFKITPVEMEQNSSIKVNIIYFSNFQLKDFLSTDLNM